MQAVDVLPVVEDEEQAEAKHGHDMCRQWQEEEEEVAVVPPADAVVHPRTVVVEILQHWWWEDTEVRKLAQSHGTYCIILYLLVLNM